MNAVENNPEYWREFHAPPDDRSPWEWARDTVRLKNSPFGDRFLPDLTPWLKGPLEELAKNENTEITCMCCVQGGKTVLMQMGAAYAIAFEAGPMMFNCQTDDDADDFAKERWATTLMSIPGIEGRLPPDKARRSFNKLSLTDMFMLIQGANRQNLQSKSIRWLFNDEVFLWKTGLLDEARKRTTQYWNRRRVNGSTAGEKGCDLDQAYEAGDKREWHLACPKCGALNLPKWERIKWPKDDSMRLASGDWNYREVMARAFFECEHCGAQHPHTEEAHKKMNAGAKYIATNPNPTPGWISFRWNALCLSPSVCSWGDLAVEWLKAEAEFAKGNEAPRKEFIQKRLAESYDPMRYLTFEKIPTVKIDENLAYDYIFLTVDVQEVEFWAVVRAWSKSGQSWLLWAGRLFTWDEIESKQTEFKVPSQCVFIDAAYEQNRVIRECAKRNKLVDLNGKQDWLGWKALDGENQESRSFVYKPKNSKAMLLPYSWPAKYLSGNSGVATGVAFAKFHLWSNRTAKDILWRLRDGRGAKWLAYDQAPQDWHEQMYSERRIRDYNKFNKETIKWERIGKRPNHLWDCEAMQVVAACMAQIIGETIPVEAKEVKEEANGS
jgi:hypothetical protein